MSQRDKEPRDEAIYRALSHPLRRRILRVLEESREPLSPLDCTEKGRLNDDRLGTIAYHFRLLAKLGLIEIAFEEAVRGSVKHYYRPSKPFPPELRDTLALDRIAALLEDEASKAAKGVLREILDIVASSGRPVRRSK
jgi:DNA-binding transcriptional ArsR family regulator